jgi:hypothetical protein
MFIASTSDLNLAMERKLKKYVDSLSDNIFFCKSFKNFIIILSSQA